MQVGSNHSPNPVGSEAGTVVAVVIVVLTAVVFFVARFVGGSKQKALDAENYQEFELAEKTVISHDTRRFRFKLQSPTTVLGLPIGKHVSFRFVNKEKGNKVVSRSYTPTSCDLDVGHVDFVIKVYFPNVRPKFPNGGEMSHHLEKLNIGDAVEMRGPKGGLEYVGNRQFVIKRQGQKTIGKIGMIAGGTGITPMLQILDALVRERGPGIEVSLLFCNQTEEDILLRDHIESYKDKLHGFKLHYTLDSPPAGWKYSSGFVDEAMLKAHMPPPANDTLIVMCGPRPMIKIACIPNLETLGYTADMLYSF